MPTPRKPRPKAKPKAVPAPVTPAPVTRPQPIPPATRKGSHLPDISRLATAIIVVVVVIVGGVVVIVHPAALDFAAYIRDVAVAVGLLAVGHGIDKNSTP